VALALSIKSRAAVTADARRRAAASIACLADTAAAAASPMFS
jgi:hypothetical protein